MKQKLVSLCPLVSDRQLPGAQCEGSFSAQPCSEGSADSLACLCVRKEPQNCCRDTWACQGCSSGLAVTGRHTLLTGPASPPKWYFPNCVRTAKCRNQNADSCIPPLMFWSGVGSKNLQVVWCFDVLRSTFKESCPLVDGQLRQWHQQV